MRKNIFEEACLEEKHRRKYEKEHGYDYTGRYATMDHISPGKKAILLLVVAIFAVFGVLWGLDKIAEAEASFQQIKEDTIKEMQDMTYRSNGGQYNEKE